MDFTTVIKTRRSVRAYADKPIPDDALARILEAARLAPSACNFQPWRFIVVKDVATRSELAKQAHSQSFVAKAPVVIVCRAKRGWLRQLKRGIQGVARRFNKHFRMTGGTAYGSLDFLLIFRPRFSRWDRWPTTCSTNFNALVAF